ncbi:hypothetical protein [Mesorhizobium sp. M0586]|uniref:hypothetical protein n=1 Tax=unclassified Mesorhizobium TaxID=325217 RepID=UPI00333B389E
MGHLGTTSWTPFSITAAMKLTRREKRFRRAIYSDAPAIFEATIAFASSDIRSFLPDSNSTNSAITDPLGLGKWPDNLLLSV